MGKKISKSTIARLNNLSAEKLESHSIIEPAPHGGYICPECGNGSGRDGTGFDVNRKVEGWTSWHCHKCHTTFNNLQLLAKHYNLDIRSDFTQLVEKTCDDFHLPFDYDDFDAPKRHRRKQKTKTADKPSKEELKFIHADLQADTQPLKNFCHFGYGDKWRGLPTDLLLKFGCRHISDWQSPKSRAEGKFAYKLPYMLIPAGDDSYLARLTLELRNLDDAEREYAKDRTKIHAGQKTLFNASALNSADPIFAVEGYIDALSILHAGYQAVSLGAASRGDLLVNSVQSMDTKPQIIILLDPDETGRKEATNLYNDLISVGCPAVIRFLSAEDSKLDANDILVKDGKDALSEVLQKILTDSLSELAAVETELKTKKETRLADDDLNFYFDGDLSDLDFSKRLERYCGDKIRWLKDDSKWTTYGNGVWTIYNDKKACVLPFALDLSAVLAEYALDDDDRKIAKCFKSTVKQSAAITLLTGAHAVRITSTDLDNHPELLNALNGVVDLQTGKLYPHDTETQKLLLTQQVNAIYDSTAKSEIVDKFFADIQPDETTRNGLLRWLGYCLTGLTIEEKFMVWHGRGCNGKGLLSGTLLELLGGYGCGLSPRALLKKSKLADDANTATTALNPLRIARFAISEETPSDAELDCSILKNLTGGDRFNLRKNYGEYESVKLSAKLNISGNYLPRIENINDGGMLRRLLNMPFKVQFGTTEYPRDDQLKSKMILPENLNALLAVLVREAGYWYESGLIISPEMQSETKRHLSQNNFVSDFVEDNDYQIDAKLSINAKKFLADLRAEYPRECSRFSRADLIQMIERVTGAVYTFGNGNKRIFKGVGKVFDSRNNFEVGEPINSNDVPSF